MKTGFLWGAASAAYQIEGAFDEDGKGWSIWDKFVRIPGKTFKGTNGNVAVDHYHHWKEDIGLMAEMGLKAYRFSISWPRVIPDGDGAPNEKGIAFYDNIINECLRHGIEPMVTLYHWDLPQALQDRYGGWESRQCADAFAVYAKLLFERYGDRVKYWITINEQNIFTKFGYVTAWHPPGIFNDRKRWLQANHNVNLAHAKAVLAFHDLVPDGQIGVSFAYGPGYAFDCAPENVLACQDYNELENYWWLDVYCYGAYPAAGVAYYTAEGVMPEVTTGDKMLLNEAPKQLDFLGFNYYHSNVSEANPLDGATQFGHMNNSGDKGSDDIMGVPGLYKMPPNPYLRTTDWDWAIDPEGLLYACRALRGLRPASPLRGHERDPRARQLEHAKRFRRHEERQRVQPALRRRRARGGRPKQGPHPHRCRLQHEHQHHDRPRERLAAAAGHDQRSHDGLAPLLRPVRLHDQL